MVMVVVSRAAGANVFIGRLDILQAINSLPETRTELVDFRLDAVVLGGV